MTKELFLEEIEIFYQNNKYLKYKNVEKLFEKVQEYYFNHYEEIALYIEVYDYKEKNDKLIVSTNIGHFLTNNEKIKKYKGKKIDAKEFFKSVTNSRKLLFFESERKTEYEKKLEEFEDYLQVYYNYRNLTDPKEIKRLFSNFNYVSIKSISRVFNLECLNNPEFYHVNSFDYLRLPSVFAEVYEYFKYDNNKKLLFLVLICGVEDDYPSLKNSNIILENFEEFKEFVVEELSVKAQNNSIIKLVYEYLSTNDLFKEFSEEELKKMYMANPYYYMLNPKIFKNAANSIKNTSELVKIDSTSEEKIHVRMHDYDVYKGKTVEYQKKNRDRVLNFELLFLYNNKTIYKLYNMYYKSYMNVMNEKGLKNKDNLKDFIGFLLDSKHLITLYNNPNILVNDMFELEQFLDFYDEKLKQGVTNLKQKLRKTTLDFYNEVIKNQNDIRKIEEILSKYGLPKEKFHAFIINNKFLSSKEKSGLINVMYNNFEDYFKKYIRVIDILNILEDMYERNLTLDEVLKENNISKKDFSLIRKKLKNDNQIIEIYIGEKLRQNRYIYYRRLLELGYAVLNSNIKSIEEYNSSFKGQMNFYELIQKLETTDLSDKLIEKASDFEDFDINLLSPKEVKEYTLKMQYDIIDV